MLAKGPKLLILKYCLLIFCICSLAGGEQPKLSLDLKSEGMANLLQRFNAQELSMIKSDVKIFAVEKQIEALEPLLRRIQEAMDLKEKIAILDEISGVQEYLAQAPVKAYFPQLNEECLYALKSLIAIGQGPIVFQGLDHTPDAFEKLSLMLDTLLEVENFYDTIGGLIGYHLTVLKLIQEKKGKVSQSTAGTRYLQPEGLHLGEDTAKVRQAVRWGIESLPQMAEIYPVGGAGDRLSLIDEESKEPLPAAQLQFGGRSLLEGLIRDLQGREYLHYKLCNQQVNTPVAMMTSFEKNNYYHIRQICIENNWFGRAKESFVFFTQPLVPVITKEGYWALSEPLKLTLKPGGHGILWKLMHENAIFDVLSELGRRKAIVRQINNPIAGTDQGLLAFAGIGCHEDKSFGFASCPRLIKAPEGVDVVIEKQSEDGYEYSLTNIEYTEFEQRGIKDMPAEGDSKFSAFPSNTNILFADLQAVEIAAEACPAPGLLINMKSKTSCLDVNGNIHAIEAGRLESTMQNIADFIVDKVSEPQEHFDKLSAFITFNERRKTISVTKSSYVDGQNVHGTPEGCLYDLLQNNSDLLKNYCGMQVPSLGAEHDFVKNDPAFIFWYHPALGPLYEVIKQKIQGGSLAHGAELQLEIADLEMRQVYIEGSLIIEAENVLGGLDENGNALYGAMTGKCALRNVTVRNKGIDRQAKNIYWKNQVNRLEEFRIVLRGDAEFEAQGVTFEGDELIEVPAGHRMLAYSEGGEVKYRVEKISGPTWTWNYVFDADDRVKLNKK